MCEELSSSVHVHAAGTAAIGAMAIAGGLVPLHARQIIHLAHVPGGHEPVLEVRLDHALQLPLLGIIQ